MANVESFTLVCKGIGILRFLQDSHPLLAGLGNSLTKLRITSPHWHSPVHQTATIGSYMSPVYECARLRDLEISLPTTYFTFRLADLEELFHRCSELRALTLSCSLNGDSSIPDIQDIFLMIPACLVALHLPALKTTQSDRQFALTTPRPLLTKLSSDQLTLGHHILDIAWALSTTSACRPTSEDMAPTVWIQIYRVVRMLKSRNNPALADFLVSMWNQSSCATHPYVMNRPAHVV